MCTGPHAFIPAPTAARVEVRMQQDDQQIENVLWVDFGTTPTLDLLEATTTAVSNWYIDHLAPIQANNVQGVAVIATAWDTETGLQVTDNAIATVVGSNSGAPLPNAVSLAIHFGTTHRGRSYQGHIMHAGLVEPNISGNDITGAAAGAIIGVYDDLLTALGGSPGQLAVASFCHDKAWRTTAVLTPVTGVTLKDLVLDQAIRRKPGRGR